MSSAAWYRFISGHEPPATAPGRGFKATEPGDRRRRLDGVHLVDAERGDVISEYPLLVLERCHEPE